MNEGKIQAVHSSGETCFWCEKEIPRGDPAVRVEFNVNALVTTITKHEFAHADCGEGIGWLLLKRVKEAKEFPRRKR